MTRRRGNEERVPLTPAFLVAAASSYEGMDLARVVKPDIRADVAFVNHVGYWSHFGSALKSSRWPLPEVGSAEELAQWAGISGKLTTDPLEGDVFLIWDAGCKEFTRAGVVSRVVRRKKPLGDAPADLCEVIEGGSSADPLAHRFCVDRHERFFLPTDRFVRWAPPAQLEADFAWRLVYEHLESHENRDKHTTRGRAEAA